MDHNSTGIAREYTTNNFVLGGKIMLSAVITLFFVLIIIFCLHRYARLFLYRAHTHHNRRRTTYHRHRSQFFFSSVDTLFVPSSGGLDTSVLKSLPIFVYPSKTHDQVRDCAVCLSEFEENEKGRLLPECNHSFHIECIDMWFHSHSTCPLCRSPVFKPDVAAPAVKIDPAEILISMGELGESEDEMGASSSCSSSTINSMMDPLESGRKPLELVGLSIDVPIDTGDRKDVVSPSSVTALRSCRTVTEADLEGGEEKAGACHHPVTQEQRHSHPHECLCFSP